MFSFFRICEGHRDSIVEVAFTPDSQFLVSACSDGNFKLWCLMPCSDECIMTQEGAHDLGVQSCDFSPFEGTEGNIINQCNYKSQLKINASC